MKNGGKGERKRGNRSESCSEEKRERREEEFARRIPLDMHLSNFFVAGRVRREGQGRDKKTRKRVKLDPYVCTYILRFGHA